MFLLSSWKDALSLRLARSQRRMLPKPTEWLTKSVAPPAARAFPSGLKATAEALPHGPITQENSASLLSDSRSHSFTLPSMLAEARVLPSGLNATETTPKVLRHQVLVPLATSQSLVSPMFAEAKTFPSGREATDRAACPFSIAFR